MENDTSPPNVGVPPREVMPVPAASRRAAYYNPYHPAPMPDWTRGELSFCEQRCVVALGKTNELGFFEACVLNEVGIVVMARSLKGFVGVYGMTANS